MSKIDEGYYICTSQLSNYSTRFFLTSGELCILFLSCTSHAAKCHHNHYEEIAFVVFVFLTENPYMRTVSPRTLSVIAGESVTLEFTVALNSNGVTSNNNEVSFTFVNLNGVPEIVNFHTSNPVYPQNYVYIVERVNQTHAGVYAAQAPSMFTNTTFWGDCCNKYTYIIAAEPILLYAIVLEWVKIYIAYLINQLSSKYIMMNTYTGQDCRSETQECGIVSVNITLDVTSKCILIQTSNRTDGNLFLSMNVIISKFLSLLCQRVQWWLTLAKNSLQHVGLHAV